MVIPHNKSHSNSTKIASLHADAHLADICSASSNKVLIICPIKVLVIIKNEIYLINNRRTYICLSFVILAKVFSQCVHYQLVDQCYLITNSLETGSRILRHLCS